MQFPLYTQETNFLTGYVLRLVGDDTGAPQLPELWEVFTGMNEEGRSGQFSELYPRPT